MTTMSHLDKPILFLATANAARSRDFYQRVLGLDLVADEPPALVFQVGHSMLRIQKVDHVSLLHTPQWDGQFLIFAGQCSICAERELYFSVTKA